MHPHPPLPDIPDTTLQDFRLLLDNAVDYAIILLDEAGTVREWSAGAERIFGWKREEILGRPAALFFTPEDRELGVPEKEMRGADAGRQFPDERWHLRKSGERFWASGLLYRLADREGRTHGYAKILRDFTRQHLTAEALLESERKLEFFLENLEGHALFMVNPAGEIASWNKGAERLFGYAESEAVGKDLTFLYAPEDAQAGTARRELEETRQAGRTYQEQWLHRKDGSRFWAAFSTLPLRDSAGAMAGFTRVVRDATDRKRAEEAHRMEGIGRLAGGVAHDFNNMLTAINGYCDLLLSEASLPDPPREWIQEIRNAGDRAAALTRQLLAFSRKQVLAPRPLNLNEALRDLEPLLRRTLGEDIRILTELDPSLEKVMLDQSQFEQVILNLAINSREAMPEGGSIEIATANTYISGGAVPEHLPVEPGPYVLVRFRDTGAGMEPSVKARIFEPFFSTKAQGAGSTGLGLSTVYGAVRQSGGAISVDSQPGKGTEFRLYFPTTREAGPAQPADPAVGAEAPPNRILLLVEDEHSVRKLTAQVLGMNGFTVAEAKDGAEAIVWLESHPEEIHLVLTDVVMPNMGGVELARRVHVLRPGVPVVFMSGYTEESVLPAGVQEKARFIQKPFTVPYLLSQVREALEPVRQAPK